MRSHTHPRACVVIEWSFKVRPGSRKSASPKQTKEKLPSLKQNSITVWDNVLKFSTLKKILNVYQWSVRMSSNEAAKKMGFIDKSLMV